MSPLALALALAAQVSGTLRYQDREYDSGGFTGAQPFLPIRQAEVELAAAAAPMVPIAFSTTNDAGFFTFPAGPPNTQVLVRVYARRTTGPVNAVVKNNAAADAVYAAVTGNATTDGAGSATLSQDFTIAGGAAPAFNIFDCAVRSFQYQASLTAVPPAVLPLLTVYWQAGSGNGTYYDDGPDAIFLLGLASDPDQYDDDIILHEMGHWVSDNFSKDDTLGGPHSITSQLDPRTSWSEGWAHYWSAAVRRAGGYLQPNLQVDNFGSGNSVFDLEGPSAPAQTVMATNEVAVAAVLWDITDPANEAFDLVSAGSTADGTERDVWESVDLFLPGRANVTLEDFRDGLAAEAPALMPLVTGAEGLTRIMNSRSILYFPDGFEANDLPASATALVVDGGASRRTIFPAGDEDWYRLVLDKAGTVYAETFALGDGANTIVEIFSEDGSTLLAGNDNRSPFDRSSFVFHPVEAPVTLLARVRRSGNVVENGYYDLAVRLGPPLEGPAPQVGYCSGSVPPPGWSPALLLAVLGALACFRRRS